MIFLGMYLLAITPKEPSTQQEMPKPVAAIIKPNADSTFFPPPACTQIAEKIVEATGVTISRDTNVSIFFEGPALDAMTLLCPLKDSPATGAILISRVPKVTEDYLNVVTAVSVVLVNEPLKARVAAVRKCLDQARQAPMFQGVIDGKQYGQFTCTKLRGRGDLFEVAVFTPNPRSAAGQVAAIEHKEPELPTPEQQRIDQEFADFRALTAAEQKAVIEQAKKDAVQAVLDFRAMQDHHAPGDVRKAGDRATEAERHMADLRAAADDQGPAFDPWAPTCPLHNFKIRRASWHRVSVDYVEVVGEIYNGCSEPLIPSLNAVFRNRAGNIVAEKDLGNGGICALPLAAKGTCQFRKTVALYEYQPAATLSVEVTELSR